MAFPYFHAYYLAVHDETAPYDEILRAYYSPQGFYLVARAAIDAAEAGRYDIMHELAEQAHSLLSQSARNKGGADRQLELRMNAVIDEADKRSK